MKTRFSFWKIASGIWKRKLTASARSIFAIWAVPSKEADSLTRVEFYSLMEQFFALLAVQELVDTAVQNHEAGGDC